MNRLSLSAVGFLAVVLAAVAEGEAETGAPAKELEYLLEPSQLRDFLADPPDNIYLVDTRTPEEYISGHIPTAIQIDYRDIGRIPPTDQKDALIVVYCRSGARSNTAARTLGALGYTRVLDWGGIVDWPFDVITGAETE